jgi:hypothetical protein
MKYLWNLKLTKRSGQIWVISYPIEQVMTEDVSVSTRSVGISKQDRTGCRRTNLPRAELRSAITTLTQDVPCILENLKNRE